MCDVVEFNVKFNTGNAAFKDNPFEAERLIKQATFGATRALQSVNGDEPKEGSLRDSNGNKVGSWWVITPDPPEDDE